MIIEHDRAAIALKRLLVVLGDGMRVEKSPSSKVSKEPVDLKQAMARVVNEHKKTFNMADAVKLVTTYDDMTFVLNQAGFLCSFQSNLLWLVTNRPGPEVQKALIYYVSACQALLAAYEAIRLGGAYFQEYEVRIMLKGVDEFARLSKKALTQLS